MVSRIRIDRLLVERGLFESRAKAQAAIAAGCVSADDVVVGNSYNTIELEGDEDEAAFYVLNVSIDAPSAERELAAALRRLQDDSLRG